MTPRELADRLAQVPPANVPALGLLLKLTSGQMSDAEYADATAEIETAVTALVGHAQVAVRLIGGVLACTPQPAAQAPTGF